MSINSLLKKEGTVPEQWKELQVYSLDVQDVIGVSNIVANNINTATISIGGTNDSNKISIYQSLQHPTGDAAVIFTHSATPGWISYVKIGKLVTVQVVAKETDRFLVAGGTPSLDFANLGPLGTALGVDIQGIIGDNNNISIPIMVTQTNSDPLEVPGKVLTNPNQLTFKIVQLATGAAPGEIVVPHAYIDLPDNATIKNFSFSFITAA
jgi:hypothetical protein